MAEVVAGGLRFHVQRPASQHDSGRPVVVFIHGLVVDNLSSFYYTLANPVVRAGAEVILYDLRGHGRSERPETGYGADDAVADLDGLLDALSIDRPVYLVGNSFGGVVAARMGLLHPERVAGLVLIESHCTGARWVEEMSNTLTAIALGLETDRVHDQLAELGERRWARQAGVANALLNETTLIEDLATSSPLRPDELAALDCPVLGVYGEHSDIVSAARDLDRYVPDGTVVILPGLGHTILRDATDTVRDLILTWLAPALSEPGGRPGSTPQPTTRAHPTGPQPTGPEAAGPQAAGPQAATRNAGQPGTAPHIRLIKGGGR